MRKLQRGNPMSESERLEHLENIIEQATRSHTWMLKSIKHKADELQCGNYSDDLKHAIVVQKLLETEK